MTTVLVVDDEPIVRDVIVRYLRRDGFATLEAADGDRARELIETADPTLVVLDVMLPGTDGLELCRWIREPLRPAGDHADRAGRGGRPDRRARARRRRLRDEAVLAARAGGPCAHRAAPRRGATTARPERLEFGDVVLDGARREVTRAGRAGDAHRARVRPALVPRLEPAPRLLARAT